MRYDRHMPTRQAGLGRSSTPPVSRRDRVRTETTAEIKDRAWRLMADSGVDALSLRAVARQMGMAPSALYRYFPSRNDLLTALIIDGFTSLTDMLELTYRTRYHAGRLPADEVFVTAAKAYRCWALEHPTQFGLMFSTSIPGYSGTPDTTAAAVRSCDFLLLIMADLVAEGGVAIERIAADLSPGLTERLAAWSEADDLALPPAALAAAMRCYATLHGHIHLDMNGHFPPSLQHDEDLFESTIRDVIARVAPCPPGETVDSSRGTQ